MTVQPTLWDQPPKARRSDPVTSHAAADSMREGAAVQRRAILAALAVGTATADELDIRCGFRPTTSGRRLKELEASGLVARVPDVTRLTRSGRAAQVWALRPAGKARLA